MSASTAASALAHLSWSKTADRSARTAPGRAASMARFERLVDPDDELTPADRAQRAEHAKRAYFRELALRSAEVRRAKRAATK